MTRKQRKINNTNARIIKKALKQYRQGKPITNEWAAELATRHGMILKGTDVYVLDMPSLEAHDLARRLNKQAGRIIYFAGSYDYDDDSNYYD